MDFHPNCPTVVLRYPRQTEIKNDKYEAAIRQAQFLMDSSRKEPDNLFARMNERF
jgi:hypothetical protein